jgi:hypothetical protein
VDKDSTQDTSNHQAYCQVSFTHRDEGAMEVGEEASEEKVGSGGLVICKYMRIRECRNGGREGGKGIVMLLSGNEGIGRRKER